MNTVALQSFWRNFVGNKSQLEGLIVRKNQSFQGKFQVGGSVEIHLLGNLLKKVEKSFQGTLEKAEVRFETNKGRIPSSFIVALGFEKEGKDFIFNNPEYFIRLTHIEDDHSYIWKIEFSTRGYSIPSTAGSLLSRLVSSVKYEMDIKTQHGLMAVV